MLIIQFQRSNGQLALSYGTALSLSVQLTLPCVLVACSISNGVKIYIWGKGRKKGVWNLGRGGGEKIDARSLVSVNHLTLPHSAAIYSINVSNFRPNPQIC